MAQQNPSIFQGVMDALRSGKRSPAPVGGVGNPGGPVPPMLTRPSGSIEDIQQQYLDWQVTKIAHDLYTRTIYYDTDRINAYQDFRAMDMSPEIAAALNIIRDECLTRNDRGDILGIFSENERVKDILEDLFVNRLNVEYNLRLWIRDLVKQGDYFVQLHIDKEDGIYNFMTLPAEEIHREEGYDGTSDSVRFRWETTNDYFEEWQVAHFRMLEDTKKLPYGRSILDPARKLWKQLQLAEDSMLVYRITRAPERRIFYIEVGNLEDTDVTQYVSKIQNQLKKQPLVNAKNGQMNMKYDPMNVTEDYFIPIRGDKSSKIDTLPGASNLGDIQDIEYLQNKLFASLQVPRTYLNFAENMPGGTTLSQADLRFSRTINSIQEAVLLELRRIANIHLYFMGFEDELDNFQLTLTNPSTQQELMKLETMKSRLEVFSGMFTPEATSPTSWTWAMQNIMGFSNNEIKLILKQKKVEKKIFAEIDAGVETYKKIGLFKDLDEKFEIEGAEEMLAQQQMGGGEEGEDLGGGEGGFGGGGMDMGGDLDMGDDMGGEDFGGEDLGGEPAAEPAGEELAELRRTVRSNNVSGVLINELLGPSEERVLAEERKKKELGSKLIQSNRIANLETRKLFETMNKKSGKEEEVLIEGEDEIKNDLTTHSNNALFERNKVMNDKAKDLFKNIKDKIDKSKEDNV